MNWLFIILLAVLICAHPCYSQDSTFQKNGFGRRINIQSKMLNENRQIFVFEPTALKNSKTKYPVIYLLDGEALFLTMVSAVQFMNSGTSMPGMPEAYVVGIINSERSRDMPVPQEIINTNGASNFFSFITKEIIPYINEHYAVSGLNIIAGHSQGALFATYAAFQKPSYFQFIIALDAPMEVSKQVEQLYIQKMLQNCRLKYASITSKYGWNEKISADSNCVHFKQIRIENETHETLPYKGIYEGLKFLFNDYLPPVADWPLSRLSAYYSSLEKKYGVPYPIPAKVLLESAKQNAAQSEKSNATALLQLHDKIYGETQYSKMLKTKTNAIDKEPDKRVAFSLAQPSPSDKAIQPYLGKWSGIVRVPEGTDVDIDWEIKKINGRYIMESDIMKQFKLQSDFLYINDKQELVWGRKHEGGGIYISVGRLSENLQKLTGTEDLIGFEFPEGMPLFRLNTFEFSKVY
jgi:uncharacterized protein involved in tolerance to divalent cations